jgi:hypothetical protein
MQNLCKVIMQSLCKQWFYFHVHTCMLSIHIWNPVHLDKIRQNRTYSYVQVRTGTYQYVPVHGSTRISLQYMAVHTGTYEYVLLKGHVVCSHTQAVF